MSVRDLPPSPEESIRLLHRIRAGDDGAVDALLERMLPRMRRWAHGRLPRSARPMLDTGDVVLAVAQKAVKQFAHLEFDGSPGLARYLKAAISNEINSSWRRADHTPIETTLGESFPASPDSPLDAIIGHERWLVYERALQQLSAQDQEVIIGRFELAYEYDELAHLLGLPSVGAARTAVHRAVKRLTEQVQGHV